MAKKTYSGAEVKAMFDEKWREAFLKAPWKYGGHAWTAVHPSMYGMPAQPFSPSPGGMPGMPHQPSFAHPHPAYTPPVSKASEGSLFENIGRAIRLGADVLNTGLTGGLQLMEGLSGRGGGCGCSSSNTSCCCDPCCCDPCDCCCNPCCCTPSVHGCC